jgi:hypothetical protein
METKAIESVEVAGEGPSPRFGSTLISIGFNDQNGVFLLFGGKSDLFSPMTLHVLKVLPQNKKNRIKCMRNVPKSEDEKLKEDKAYQHIFEVTKRNNKIKDELLMEKVKQVELLKRRAAIEKQLMELRNEHDSYMQQKEEALSRLNQDNQQKLNIIESRLEAISLEEIKEKTRRQRQIVLQTNFELLFEYPMTLYKLVGQALQNKGKEGSRDKDFRMYLEQQLPQIRSTKEKLTINVQSTKTILGEFNDSQKRLEKESAVLEAGLARMFPAFTEFKSKISEGFQFQ